MNAVDELNFLLGIGPPRPQLPVTLQKSGYTSVRALGKGSFGQAFLIFHKEKGEYYVVKHVNMTNMNSRQRKDAHNEIAVLQQLSHPNIVRYVECYEEHPHLYIVMEYADGGDIFTHLEKIKRNYGPVLKPSQGLLTEPQVISLFVQTVMAVKHMHDRRLLHRDIKSQNVFLTKNHVVKLGDFGITTVLQNTVAMASTMCGTPCYFSPELCQGKPYNNKSDVWALGVLLYELCANRLPFESTTMKALMREIVNRHPRRIPPYFSDELWALIEWMLCKDPKKRPDANQVLMTPVLMRRVPDIMAQLRGVEIVDIDPRTPRRQGNNAAAAAPPRNGRDTREDKHNKINNRAGAGGLEEENDPGECIADTAPYQQLLAKQQQIVGHAIRNGGGGGGAGGGNSDGSDPFAGAVKPSSPSGGYSTGIPGVPAGGVSPAVRAPPGKYNRPGLDDHAAKQRAAVAQKQQEKDSPTSRRPPGINAGLRAALAGKSNTAGGNLCSDPASPTPTSPSAQVPISELLARFDHEKRRITESKEKASAAAAAAVASGGGGKAKASGGSNHKSGGLAANRDSNQLRRAPQRDISAEDKAPVSPPPPPARKPIVVSVELSPGAAAAAALAVLDRQKQEQQQHQQQHNPKVSDEVKKDISAALPPFPLLSSAAAADSGGGGGSGELGAVLEEMSTHFTQFQRTIVLAPSDEAIPLPPPPPAAAAADIAPPMISHTPPPPSSTSSRPSHGGRGNGKAEAEAAAVRPPQSSSSPPSPVLSSSQQQRKQQHPSEGEEGYFADPCGAKLDVEHLKQHHPGTSAVAQQQLSASSSPRVNGGQSELLMSFNTKFQQQQQQLPPPVSNANSAKRSAAAAEGGVSAHVKVSPPLSSSPPGQSDASRTAAGITKDAEGLPQQGHLSPAQVRAAPAPSAEPQRNACADPDGAATAAAVEGVMDIIDTNNDDDDDVPFSGSCLCGSVTTSGWLSSIYGSFVCTCEACCRASGSGAGVEWLHLPNVDTLDALLTSSVRHTATSPSLLTQPAGAGLSAATALTASGSAAGSRKQRSSGGGCGDGSGDVDDVKKRSSASARAYTFSMMVEVEVEENENENDCNGKDNNGDGAAKPAQYEAHFTVYFCPMCGCMIGMRHDGMEGVLLNKTALDACSLEVLSRFAHTVMPED